MRHFASPSFWACYRDLPEPIQELADKNFELLKANLFHRSLRFKKVGKYRAVRVGLHYRALATETAKIYCSFGSGLILGTTSLWANSALQTAALQARLSLTVMRPGTAIGTRVKLVVQMRGEVGACLLKPDSRSGSSLEA